MHLALVAGAGLYGEALICDVGRDLGALVEMDGFGPHPSVDGTKNPHCLGHSRAINLPLFLDGDQSDIDIAFDRAIDLNGALAFQVAQDLEIGGDDGRNALWARIASELAKAKTIEDVDDKLAETLFGDEINFVAAQILANPPSIEPANDDLEDAAENEQPASNGAEVPEVEVTLEAPKQLDDGGTDLAASQRIKTVRALNADPRPSIREPEAVVENLAAPTPILTPDSIEDQITSMTQTLKALDVTPPVADFDDDEEKGGFFSRFKRS